jgi:hypothetical protein
MSNQISGKVIKVPQPQTGSGKNGDWIKQEFIIETTEQYPKKVCLCAWGDKANFAAQLKHGQEVTVSFNVESREHSERWYTELRAWKIDTSGQENNSEQHNSEQPKSLSKKEEMEENPDDLPF